MEEKGKAFVLISLSAPRDVYCLKRDYDSNDNSVGEETRKTGRVCCEGIALV